jgi:ribosomal protein L40E
MGRDDAAAQQEALREEHYHHWVTDDPEVLKLTKNGMLEFRARTATRILADHRKEVFLNLCPRCHELARTPKAQQCRSCGYDWHAADQITRED